MGAARAKPEGHAVVRADADFLNVLTLVDLNYHQPAIGSSTEQQRLMDYA
jgi:hypothetical protein